MTQSPGCQDIGQLGHSHEAVKTQFTHLESKAVENSQIPHDDSARAFFALLNLEFARVEAKFVRRLGGGRKTEDASQ